MKAYRVAIPIVGHAYVDVLAEDEDEAKTKAWFSDMGDRNTHKVWRQLLTFGENGICQCPSPWEISVEEV